MSLIKLLLKKEIITREQAAALEYEVKSSKKSEEEIILKDAVVTEDFLFGLKSETLKIPFKIVSVDDVKLKTMETIPEESAKYLDEEYARLFE